MLTDKKEWMLTENGFDKILELLHIPQSQKEVLPTKSFEVEKIVRKIKESPRPRPRSYDPFDKEKQKTTITKETAIRARGFRQAVIEAYDYRCAICRFKINSPDLLLWEVQAAHIVPHHLKGKDDIWNGVALCHLHHWAFDVGWFTILDDYKVHLSSKAANIQNDFGKIGEYDFIKSLLLKNDTIFLPDKKERYPHQNSLKWHRENIFHH